MVYYGDMQSELHDWAKKIDNWNDHFWGRKDQKRKVKDKSKPSVFIGAIIANAILIYVFNNLLNWYIPWLMQTFVTALWIFNISFGATILFNMLYLAYDAKWFRTLGQLCLNIISLAAISTLYQVFPFAVNTNHENNIRLFLIIILFCIFIAIVVELTKLVSYFFRLIFGWN